MRTEPPPAPAGGGAADSDEDDDSWGEESDWSAPAPSDRSRQEQPSPGTATPARRDFAAASPSTLAGVDVWERESINPSAMPWFTRDYGIRRKKFSTGATRFTSLLPRSRRLWAWISFSLLCVLVALPLLSMIAEAAADLRMLEGAAGTDAAEALVTNLFSIVIFLLLGPGLALLAGLRRARRDKGLVRYVLYLVVGVAFCVQLTRTIDIRAAAPLALVLGLFVLTVELFRASKPPLNARRQLLPRADVRRFNRWGTPGGADRRSSPAPPGRIAAQLMTGQLISTVLQAVPGSKAVHGLRMPGSDVVVNHAILCGNRLAVVNSEAWPAGDAFWLNESLVVARPHQQAAVVPYRFAQAPGAFAAVFRTMQVRGWIVLHSEDGRGFRTNNQEAGSKPQLSTPADFLSEVGEWLSEEHPARVRRRVLSASVLQHQR